MKLHVHHHTMVLYILYKFNVIPSNGNLDRTEYGKTGGRTKPNLYLSALCGGGGGKKGDKTKIMTQQCIQLNTGAKEIQQLNPGDA